MNTSMIEAIERQKTTNLYDASKSIPDDEFVSWCAWRHSPRPRSTYRIGAL
jgi:hypothetical protein